MSETLSKYIHGWIPTSAFLRKQDREAPDCPFCRTQPDLTTHFLTCTDASTISTRLEAWNKCMNFLLEVPHGCPTIMDIFDHKVLERIYLPHHTRSRRMGRPRVAVLQAVLWASAAQDIIRWDLFLRGFLAVE